MADERLVLATRRDRCRVRRRTAVGAVAVSFVVALTFTSPAAVQAAPAPVFTELGTLGAGTIVLPAAISDDGVVVGVASDDAADTSAEQAFFWSASTGIRALPDLGGGFSEALVVNDANRAAGISLDASGDYHVLIWDIALPSGTVTMIDAGNPGTMAPVVVDINDGGTVVGNGDTLAAPGVERGFRWTEAEGIVSLATLGGAASAVTAISEPGVMVGVSDTTAGDQHATVWSLGPEASADIGTLGGSASEATDVSDTGAITGVSATAGGVFHGFSWTESEGLVDVGTIGTDPSAGAFFGRGTEVVVEVCATCPTASVFTWEPVGRQLRPVGSLGGTTLARAASPHGLIVGSGAKVPGNDPLYHPYVASGFWPAPTIHDLTPPFADRGGFGEAINDRGVMTGTYFTTGNDRGRGFVVDLGMAPDPPTRLAAAASAGVVELTWTSPDWPGAAPITAYRVYRDGAAVGETGPAELSFRDVDVVPGTSYRYEVVAVNDLATSAPSNPVTVEVAPPAPAAPVTANPSFAG